MAENDSIKNQIMILLEQLNEELYEKEDSIKMILLAILAGESAFLLGEPGTAKRMCTRRIADAFEEPDQSMVQNKGCVKYFEYLMNQFSTPDEIFGPVSLESLKKDEYRRITDRFLPKAKFAFLDEIWKASPAIQNTLLTILNEKKFHNGSSAEEVPLIGFVAASNELPQKDAGLEAIFDRFLVRIFEKPIQKDSDFFDMITSPKNVRVEIKNKLSEDMLFKFQEEAENVALPEDCRQLIRNIRNSLEVKNQEENRDDDDKYLISDRRWKKIVGLLKMCAYLNDRSEINLSDCVIIPYCLWSTEIQEAEIFTIISDLIMESFSTTFAEPDDFENEFEKIQKELPEIIKKELPEKLKGIKFPGAAAEYISTKKEILEKIEIEIITGLLSSLNKSIDYINQDFEKKTEIFRQNIFCNSVLNAKFQKTKKEMTSALEAIKSKVVLFNKAQCSLLLTDFVSLDTKIKNAVKDVNTIYSQKTIAANINKLNKIQNTEIPAILEQLEAERQFAEECFSNPVASFGESVLASEDFENYMKETKSSIDEALQENESQIASLKKIIEMMLQ